MSKPSIPDHVSTTKTPPGFRRLRSSAAGIASLWLVLVASACHAQLGLRPAPTGKSVTFTHEGNEREYRLHVPSTVHEETPVPLVVCLHGGGGNSKSGSAMGLSQVADQHGFIVVYPNAINKHWNDGRESPMFAEHDRTIDDVSFVKSIIRRVSDEHNIDANRVFATGLSNGGFLTQRLAMEQPQLFAAVGIVIATMGEPISEQFHPDLPVSVIYINGTEDQLVPYTGGPVGGSLPGTRLRGNIADAPRGRCISTDKAVSMWVKRNRIASVPTVAKVPDSDRNDGSHIEMSLWENGERGTAVALYKVIGGGHGLPGGTQYMPERIIGRINQDVKGFDVIWDFFKKYARQPDAAKSVGAGQVMPQPVPTAGSGTLSENNIRLQEFPSLVFPEKQWQTASAESVGWNARALEKALDFAMKRKSSSVVVTVGGRIVAERHVIVESPGFLYRQALQGITSDGHQIEDVASIQKSVSSVLLGIALAKDFVKLDDPVHQHLGAGWSRATDKQEAAITVRHLITMTSGLNNELEYQAPPGTQWDYNTQAYSKTLDVITRASGRPRSECTQEWLAGPLNMTNSHWVTRKRRGRETGVGFATTARDLARFGLLVMNKGAWAGQDIVKNAAYLSAATSPSQKLNPAYGYLWWLNGQPFTLRPGRKIEVPGPMISTAPPDLFAAKGALGRMVYVVPSLQMVVTRLGDNPDGVGRPKFEAEFWRLLMQSRKP